MCFFLRFHGESDIMFARRCDSKFVGILRNGFDPWIDFTIGLGISWSWFVKLLFKNKKIQHKIHVQVIEILCCLRLLLLAERCQLDARLDKKNKSRKNRKLKFNIPISFSSWDHLQPLCSTRWKKPIPLIIPHLVSQQIIMRRRKRRAEIIPP